MTHQLAAQQAFNEAPDLALEWLRLRQAVQTIKTIGFVIESVDETAAAANLRALADEIDAVASAGLRRTTEPGLRPNEA